MVRLIARVWVKLDSNLFCFNSKSGSIDSWQTQKGIQVVLSFNSKSGSIDSDNVTSNAFNELRVSIPKVVRLIVLHMSLQSEQALMFQFQKWFD